MTAKRQQRDLRTDTGPVGETAPAGKARPMGRQELIELAAAQARTDRERARRTIRGRRPESPEGTPVAGGGDALVRLAEWYERVDPLARTMFAVGLVAAIFAGLIIGHLG